jgi:nicotinamide riboside kinase
MISNQQDRNLKINYDNTDTLDLMQESFPLRSANCRHVLFTGIASSGKSTVLEYMRQSVEITKKEFVMFTEVSRKIIEQHYLSPHENPNCSRPSFYPSLEDLLHFSTAPESSLYDLSNYILNQLRIGENKNNSIEFTRRERIVAAGFVVACFMPPTIPVIWDRSFIEEGFHGLLRGDPPFFNDDVKRNRFRKVFIFEPLPFKDDDGVRLELDAQDRKTQHLLLLAELKRLGYSPIIVKSHQNMNIKQSIKTRSMFIADCLKDV